MMGVTIFKDIFCWSVRVGGSEWLLRKQNEYRTRGEGQFNVFVYVLQRRFDNFLANAADKFY